MTAAAVSETYTADEMMAVAAARRLTDDNVCFVGIGLPSVAANLARHTHAPGCTLIYESGTIGAKPVELPLSIGDGELAERRTPWSRCRRSSATGSRAVASMSASSAPPDRPARNLNSTVIGSYERPPCGCRGAAARPRSHWASSRSS